MHCYVILSNHGLYTCIGFNFILCSLPMVPCSNLLRYIFNFWYLIPYHYTIKFNNDYIISNDYTWHLQYLVLDRRMYRRAN